MFTKGSAVCLLTICQGYFLYVASLCPGSLLLHIFSSLSRDVTVAGICLFASNFYLRDIRSFFSAVSGGFDLCRCFFVLFFFAYFLLWFLCNCNRLLLYLSWVSFWECLMVFMSLINVFSYIGFYVFVVGRIWKYNIFFFLLF